MEIGMFHKSFDMATGNGTAVREQEMAWLFKTGLASKCLTKYVNLRNKI